MFFPAMLLGTEMLAGFWKTIWPLGVLVILALLGMNLYFLVNRRLFTLLEKEDWPALAVWLEKKVYQEGRYTSRYVKLLAQAHLVQGNFDVVLQLEAKVAAVKPLLADENVLLFGAARVLSVKPDTSDYFKSYLDRDKNRNSGLVEWVRWYYGFSLINTGVLEINRFEKSTAVFSELAAGAKDNLVAGLSAYYLCAILADKFPVETTAIAAGGKGRVQRAVKTIISNYGISFNCIHHRTYKRGHS